MAIVDYFDILSDRQVIDGTCYSNQAKDLQAASDWGSSAIMRFVKVIVEGTHSKALTIQLMGANKPDFTDAFVIAQTVQIPAADLVRGKVFYLPVSSLGKKYRYFCLKYLPAGGSDSATENPEGGNYCPPSPVLSEQEEVENGISAFFSLIDDYHVEYPYVNQDKYTV